MNALAVISTANEIIGVILSLTARLQQASTVLQKAHVEGWAQDDVRWNQAFADADTALTEALARLRG
jgi:hypothetical protein